MKRPTIPAVDAPIWTWTLAATPVEVAPAPDAVPVADPVALAPVPDAEPEATEPVVAAPEDDPAAAMAVWVVGKKLAMQACWHSAYFLVAAGEPSPWSHFMAHWVVSSTCEELGWAAPTHAAWQLTSPAGQAAMQVWAGERPLTIEAAAVTVPEAWGWANAPATREDRRIMEYFILSVGLVV